MYLLRFFVLLYLEHLLVAFREQAEILLLLYHTIRQRDGTNIRTTLEMESRKVSLHLRQEIMLYQVER